MSQDVSLYARWKKLYPRHQTGFFRTLRWGITWFLLGLYYGLPFVRWQREGALPDQAVLFDLPARQFYLFDMTIWPQDVFLLTFLLMAAALALFFMTALAGRVFCGYLCFQTLWTDLFLYVERVVEGDRKRRIKLDRAGWSLRKVAKKAIKHTLWLLIGLATGAVFVFYFGDAWTYGRGFLRGEAPFAAWVTLISITLGTYVFAGMAREQVCIFMCPYARFQGAMFDEETLTVAYDPILGDPREGNRRVRRRHDREGTPVGACIDCRACVTVCPTGIDIRDGQQYECITCAACIDACDAVMALMNADIQLIRYTSLKEMSGQKTRLIRARPLIYGGLLVAILLGVAGYLMAHEAVDLNVVRHRNPVYIRQTDGSVQNNYTLRILNMSARTQRYALSVVGLPGARFSVAAVSDRDQAGHPVLSVGPGQVVPFTVYVRQPPHHGTSGSTTMVFTLRAEHPEGGKDQYQTVFMRPIDDE